MSRPIRKPLPSSRSDAAAPPSSPASQARQALDSGRYREAVELFKELLKQERRSEWVDGLAASYAGRASELAGKGMLQEALVVWRNRSSLCDKPLVEGPYLDWLLRNGDHHVALRLLTTPDVQATELETRLAAVALTAPDSALAQLPDDTALRRHRSAALAAVAACCRGDAVDLDAQLRAIPFRSPYRDLRFVLKALLLVGDDAAQAAEMIVRVAVDGPFEKLAAVVRTALLPGSRWLAAMLDLEDDGRQLLLDLKGCPENRRSLLLDVAQLARLGVPPAPSRVFDLLLRRYRGLPATAASLCRRLLPHADKRTAEYEKAFAPLGDAEGSCVMALAAEAQGSFERSEAFWLRAVRLLSSEGKSLPAALILRHLFDLVVGDADPSDFSSECTTWLARSLELDPDDRATHLQLIRIHRQAKDLRAARAAVEVAIARFANDPAVLLEAVETALAGNAFKKAVTLAKRLLELDPINSKVRALIGQAHLSHARRQIRSGRPDAAGKEIDLAEQWLGSANERSIAKLLRGLSATDERATLLLREGVAELGGKLLAALHVLLESVSLGGQASAALRRAGINLSGTPAAREVLALARALNALGEAERKKLRRVFSTLLAPLRRAAGADFSESERISICETLLRLEERPLLQAYADAGLKHSPGRPVFVYFSTFARHGRSAFMLMSTREGLDLETALQTAEDDGDQRTVLRIRELLLPPGQLVGGGRERFDDGADEDIDLPVDARAVFEMLASLGGEQEAIAMLREVVPDSEFRQCERAADGNRKKLLGMLIKHMADLGQSVAAAPASERPRPRPAAAKGKQPSADDRQKGLFDD